MATAWAIRGAAMSQQGRLEASGYQLVQTAVSEALDPTPYDHASVLTVENACAGGATVLEVGAMALRGGSGPVLVIGAERVSATGVLQVVELYEQLMGRCGDHQIAGEPKIAFAENQGGLSGYADVAALGMTVLKKD